MSKENAIKPFKNINRSGNTHFKRKLGGNICNKNVI